MTHYSLEDHAQATSALAQLKEKWENYSGNNPNKFRAAMESAKAKLLTISTELKAAGLLERNPAEERDALLDAEFPAARSKDVVTWEGRRFMKRFSPAATSLSGKTVIAWNTYWEELVE